MLFARPDLILADFARRRAEGEVEVYRLAALDDRAEERVIRVGCVVGAGGGVVSMVIFNAALCADDAPGGLTA